MSKDRMKPFSGEWSALIFSKSACEREIITTQIGRDNASLLGQRLLGIHLDMLRFSHAVAIEHHAPQESLDKLANRIVFFEEALSGQTTDRNKLREAIVSLVASCYGKQFAVNQSESIVADKLMQISRKI
ncbi:MAG: hypothetical protein Q8P10_03645 [bacterium]|nr:hypothetical protein [bacterium]